MPFRITPTKGFKKRLVERHSIHEMSVRVSFALSVSVLVALSACDSEPGDRMSEEEYFDR